MGFSHALRLVSLLVKFLSSACLVFPHDENANTKRPAIPDMLLANGVRFPALAIGTVPPMNVSQIEEQLQMGYRSFDTANTYHTEELVGEAIASSGLPRADVFLTSKVEGCGVDWSKINAVMKSNPLIRESNCYEDTVKGVELTLERIKTDFVDLMLLHRTPSIGCGEGAGCAAVQAQWRALEDIYIKGKARAIGVSNYCQKCLECLLQTAQVKPHVNQLNLHVGMGPDPEGLVSFMKQHKIVPSAWGPLGGTEKQLFSNSTFHEITQGEQTANFAKHSGHLPAQVAFKWLYQHGIHIVTASGSKPHLKQNLEALDGSWSLSTEEMRQLDEFKTSGSFSSQQISAC